MMKVSLAFLCVLLGSSLYALEMDRMKVILDVNEAPPFFSKDLPYNGMCGEILHEISEAAGIDTEIRFKPLSRIIEEGENNVVGDPAFFMASQDFSAIIPITLYQIALFHYVTKDDTEDHENINSLAEIGKSRIGILKGSLIDPLYFKSKGIVFETSYSDDSLFKKLRLQRLDYVVAIELVGSHIIHKLFEAEEEDFLAMHIENSVNPIAILLSEEQENSKDIAKKYKEGLDQIVANGRYEKILEKYYDSKEKIRFNWKSDLENFYQLYKLEKGE